MSIENFTKYAFWGDLNKEYVNLLTKSFEDESKENLLDNEDTDESMVKRQYYIYKNICDNKRKQSNLLLLLEKLEVEIEHQYERKSQIEARAGFVIALWGILQVASYDTIRTALVNGGIIYYVFVFLLSILGFALLGMLCNCIWSEYIYAFEFNDWNSNLITAFECPEIMLVRFLEGYKNVYKNNNRVITKKGNKLNLAIGMAILYVVILHTLILIISLNK